MTRSPRRARGVPPYRTRQAHKIPDTPIPAVLARFNTVARHFPEFCDELPLRGGFSVFLPPHGASCGRFGTSLCSTEFLLVVRSGSFTIPDFSESYRTLRVRFATFLHCTVHLFHYFGFLSVTRRVSPPFCNFPTLFRSVHSLLRISRCYTIFFSGFLDSRSRARSPSTASRFYSRVCLRCYCANISCNADRTSVIVSLDNAPSASPAARD